MKNIFIQGALGKMGRALTALCDPVPLEAADVLIDFSSPQGLAAALEMACSRNIPLVSGTTGIDPTLFELPSKKIPILHASNFSLGIDLFKSMILHLKPYGPAKIEEIHHTEKKDMPSGTALDLQKLLTDAPICAKRIPRAVGTHSVTFTLDDEEITITHTAISRKVFAKGALAAAQFLIGKPPGLYNFTPQLYTKAHESCEFSCKQ